MAIWRPLGVVWGSIWGSFWAPFWAPGRVMPFLQKVAPRHSDPKKRIQNEGLIVNASAEPADPAFVGHNGCKRSVLGQLAKSLKMKSRGLPKSSQKAPK